MYEERGVGKFNRQPGVCMFVVVTKRQQQSKSFFNVVHNVYKLGLRNHKEILILHYFK